MKQILSAVETQQERYSVNDTTGVWKAVSLTPVGRTSNSLCNNIFPIVYLPRLKFTIITFHAYLRCRQN